MCACMYVCMYVCRYVGMYVYDHALQKHCTAKRMHTFACMYVCTFMYVRVCVVDIFFFVCACVYNYVCIHAYIYVYMHIYMVFMNPLFFSLARTRTHTHVRFIITWIFYEHALGVSNAVTCVRAHTRIHRHRYTYTHTYTCTYACTILHHYINATGVSNAAQLHVSLLVAHRWVRQGYTGQHTHKHTHTHTHTQNTRIHKHTCTYTRSHTHARTQKYTHTHARTHTSACVLYVCVVCVSIRRQPLYVLINP